MSVLINPDTPQEIFQKAWLFYSLGEYQKSAETIEILELTGRERHPKLRRKVFYLKGLLDLKNGVNPLDNLFQSLELYQSDLGRSRVHTQIGWFYIKQGDFERASKHLQSVSVFEDPFYWNALAWYQFHTGDIRAALERAYQALDLYRKSADLSGISLSKSNIGFFHILLGEKEVGLKFTSEAQGLIMESGDLNKYYYNLINYVAACQLFYAEEIRAYAKQNSDAELFKMLKYAEQSECFSSVGDGEPPPPPDEG